MNSLKWWIRASIELWKGEHVVSYSADKDAPSSYYKAGATAAHAIGRDVGVCTAVLQYGNAEGIGTQA